MSYIVNKMVALLFNMKVIIHISNIGHYQLLSPIFLFLIVSLPHLSPKIKNISISFGEMKIFFLTNYFFNHKQQAK